MYQTWRGGGLEKLHKTSFIWLTSTAIKKKKYRVLNISLCKHHISLEACTTWHRIYVILSEWGSWNQAGGKGMGWGGYVKAFKMVSLSWGNCLETWCEDSSQSALLSVCTWWHQPEVNKAASQGVNTPEKVYCFRQLQVHGGLWRTWRMKVCSNQWKCNERVKVSG